ncbi:F-box domain-containing protein [Mycena venus]|uniref:F-box domain-containing protein n=1 Tax=Mycena venus TaxID=2733690 RepID=A0A8H6X4P8_9AGAR|nr:F-box domain-containing protein [Mycena venus]
MQSTLAADRAHIARLDAQIQDLERSLAALRLEKAVVLERLDSVKYPVLTLPTEIISEIFAHFLPTYPLCPPLTGNLSPTLLTHICHKWREIALDTPCTVESGCYPLSIQLDEDADFAPVADIFGAILPYHARWEYLKLRLAGGHPPAIEGGLPLLRRLDLEFDRDLYDILVFRDVPLLRTVVLEVIASVNVVLPWTQLTSLTLREMWFDNCVPILQQTTNLDHCQLDLEYNGEIGPLPDITLSHLELLCCNDNNRGRMSDCLDAFIVPTLRSLEVTERFLQPEPIKFLASFLLKSGCKLQDVRLKGPRTVHEDSYRKPFPLIRRFFFDDE